MEDKYEEKYKYTIMDICKAVFTMLGASWGDTAPMKYPGLSRPELKQKAYTVGKRAAVIAHTVIRDINVEVCACAFQWGSQAYYEGWASGDW